MSHAIALKARYVFPVSRPPITGGLLTIADGRIVAVGENLTASPPVDLGDAALLPGLVNAHTHLEFSNLSAPLGERGMHLPDWIALVVAERRERAANGFGSRARERAVLQGIEELHRCGTALAGEIATWAWPREFSSGAPFEPHLIAFLEQIGLSSERAAQELAIADDWLAAPMLKGIAGGLSPHAPYSVRFDLLESLIERAGKYRVPVAMHLAESREELELLATGGGAFRELLESLGAWSDDAAFGRYGILDYLRRLAAAPRGLAVHGNYLGGEEREFIANHRDTMSVVYCPRTHDYFGHERYPLEELLAAGVRVALGTDSRASNPDLSLWGEMQYIAETYPAIDPAAILAMGTQAGAEALGMAEHFGCIEPGRTAALAVVPIEGGQAADPHELLFREAANVAGTLRVP